MAKRRFCTSIYWRYYAGMWAIHSFLVTALVNFFLLKSLLAQAPYLRVPLAGGTLVGTAGVPSSELLLLDQVSANLWSVLASVSVRW